MATTEKIIATGDLIRKRELKGINVNIDADLIQITYKEWHECDGSQVENSLQLKHYQRKYSDFNSLQQIIDLESMINMDLQRDEPQIPANSPA
jgi:hypothetical protein